MRAYGFDYSRLSGFGGTVLATRFPFLFVLTVVVFFHELGHFLVARWCGVTSRRSRSASVPRSSALMIATVRAGGCPGFRLAVT